MVIQHNYVASEDISSGLVRKKSGSYLLFNEQEKIMTFIIFCCKFLIFFKFLIIQQNSVASEEISSATSKKKSALSSLKSSIRRKTWIVPNTPVKPVTPQIKNVTQSTKTSAVDSVDKKKSSPKSLRGLIKLIPMKLPENEPISAIKKDTCSKTPIRTPMVVTLCP